MTAKEWMLKHVRNMPFSGILLLKDHPNETKLIEIGKEIIDEYNETFRDDYYFELEFSNDYSYLKKVKNPF